MRLSQARAKLRFSEEVTEEDVRVSCRLLVGALKQSATDRNGVIDLDLLESDRTVDRERVESLARNIHALLVRTPQMSMADVLAQVGLDAGADNVRAAVEYLEDQGKCKAAKGMVFLTTPE